MDDSATWANLKYKEAMAIEMLGGMLGPIAIPIDPNSGEEEAAAQSWGRGDGTSKSQRFPLRMQRAQKIEGVLNATLKSATAPKCLSVQRTPPKVLSNPHLAPESVLQSEYAKGAAKASCGETVVRKGVFGESVSSPPP